MIGYKVKETLGGGGSGINFQMASQRRETSPSDNGTNELIANLDHELLDVRIRALKCLLRKLECGIISSGSLKDRVDLLDRCRRWLSQTESSHAGKNRNNNSELDSAEKEGIELVVQLLCNLSKHKDFRDLMRKQNVDSLLTKVQPFLDGDYTCQIDALINQIVVGQHELSYEGEPSEWFDNKTCPGSAPQSSDMFTSRHKPFASTSYKNYGEVSSPYDRRSTPSTEESDTNSNIPENTHAKRTNIPIGNEDGWMQNIQFFVPSVNLSGTDRRVISSTTDSLSSTSESMVLMTVTFIRDTLTMDFPPETFIQDPALILALAQVTAGRWGDHRISYTAIQTLMKISGLLRFRFAQLNSSEYYEVPSSNILESKSSNMYYDYDNTSYSSRMTPKAGPTPNQTDGLIENFMQLFKSFARSLLYTSQDLHIWRVFESFAFTMFKCVNIFPVDSKALTLSLQGILMELSHIWERKSDYCTTVGLCLVSSSLLNSMKINNETFIVSKDVRNMLRSLSYNPILRSGWPEVFEYFFEFASMFDPSAGLLSDQKDTGDGENGENHPKNRIIKLLYVIQNASSHKEVLESLDTLQDVLLPIVLNIRQGKDSMLHVIQDVPWRDTFYRFLCVEPTTEGDEELLGRILNLFTYILQNSQDASMFKWITPLSCEKSSTALKLLGNVAVNKEIKYGGTALSNLLHSLLQFYAVVLEHASVLLSGNIKWQIFHIYAAILHSLEHGSYSNIAVLTGVTKQLTVISADETVQTKLKENPVLCMAIIHRLTDAVLNLGANGGILEGYKNSCSFYCISLCLVHMLLPVANDENFKSSNVDWIEKCAQSFQLFVMSSDSRTKCQAFHICQVLTSTTNGKLALAEISFRNSLNSLLEAAYTTFIDEKLAATIKFRAGNVVLNVLQEPDTKLRYNLVKRLQQEFQVLVDLCRLSSRVLWNADLSGVVKSSKEAISKTSDSSGLYAMDGIPYITPKVLMVLCKILMAYLQSLMDSGDVSNCLQEVTSSGICQMLFRIILRHPLKTETDPRVWLDCCCSLSTVLQTLICSSKLNRTISVILIGEKKCLSAMFSLVDVTVPSSAKGKLLEKSEEALNALCGNIFNMATILCCDAGNNFEDLGRVAWSHQNVIFSKLTHWLKVSTPFISRRAALAFSHGFLSVLSHRTTEKQETEASSPHPFLCREWNENVTYGQSLCEQLVNILKNSVDVGERMSAIKSLSALFMLSSTSVSYAVKETDVVQYSVQKLTTFGCKFFESKGAPVSNKKTPNAIHTETLSYMEFLSCLFYLSSEAKVIALKNNFPDVLHKIFAWWMSYPDASLLHMYIEALLNFTGEFPDGALAMTMTSNVVGVGPRRVPTQQSIFIDIMGILEKELSGIENNPNIKTIEVIFELLKNLCFVQECRNILLKTPVVLFVKKLHSQETKKWGTKQNAAKTKYLEFLVHASVHSDVQICISKISEGLEILVQIVESDNPPVSTLALKVLRNLCFQQSNRGRLLSENLFIPSLSNKLSQSSDLEEIEHATVSLWALISNYEKGRLFAKKAYCSEGVARALEHIRKMEQTSNSGDEQIARVIVLLETVQKLLGSSNPSKQLMNSRASSISQFS